MTRQVRRPELPPTKATWFYQAKGEPDIDDVISALKGICESMNREQLHRGDYDQMCRMSNLSSAARILSDQLYGRVTTGPHRVRRCKPELRAVQDTEGTTPAAGGRAH